MGRYSDFFASVEQQADQPDTYLEIDKPVESQTVPQASPTSEQPEESRSVLKDAAGLWGIGSGSLVKGAGWLFNSDELQALGQDTVDYWQNTLSPTQQEANQKRFVNEDWSIGDAATDWNSYFGAAIQSLPHMVPGVGLAGAAGRGALAMGLSQKAAAGAAMAGGSVGEGVTIGAMVGQEVDESIRGMSEEQKLESPYYADLRKMYDEEEATRRLSEMAANPAALKAGVVGSALGLGFNKFLGDALTKRLSGGVVKEAGKGAVLEGGTEVLQSGFESYSRQDALNEYAAQPMVYTDMVNEMVTGLAAGSVMGGAVGAAGGLQGRGRDENQQETPQEPVEQPDVTDRVVAARESAAASGSDPLEATLAGSKELLNDFVNRPIEPAFDKPEDIGGMLSEARSLQTREAYDDLMAQPPEPAFDQAENVNELLSPAPEPDVVPTQEPTEEVAGESADLVPDTESTVYDQDGVRVVERAPDNFEASAEGFDSTAFGTTPDEARRRLTQLVEKNKPTEAVLQNRDRSRPAYIEQMQSIANEPDYNRVSVSRDPNTGAPMVFERRNNEAPDSETPTVLDADKGNTDTITMSDGKGGTRKVPIQYAVVESDAVTASNNADGSANEAYGQGGLTALNNGRTAGLQAAYQKGTTQPYVDAMLADTAHGIPAESIRAKKSPVLIRLFDESAIEGIDDPGAASNVSANAELSATEQAQTDARKLDSDMLADILPGDVTGPANANFVRRYTELLGKDGAGNALRDAKGLLTATGQKRIKGALVERAYRDETLTQELTEAVDNDLKTLGDALAEAAGRWALMRERAKEGSINPDMDITDALVSAVNMIRKSRQEGVALSDLAAQVDAFAGPADQMAVEILHLFYHGKNFGRIRAKDVIAKALLDYVDAAFAAAPGPDMFGEMTTPQKALEAQRGQVEGTEDSRRVQPDGSDDRESGAAGERPVSDSSGQTDAEQSPEPGSTEEVEAAAAEAESAPTDAQKEAGNYKKGHTAVQGLAISIENPRGSTRSGTDPDGNRWERELTHHYGYFKRTEGADGDQVDVFIGPNPDSDTVFVVDQVDADGNFDEHKVMIGFDNRFTARRGYASNYDKGWTVGPIKQLTMDELKAWLKYGDTTKPFSDTLKTKAAEPTEDFDLQAQTEEQLAEDARAREEAEKAEADQSRQEEQRAQADEEVDDFVLAGSDRSVDQAEARGQGNMLDKSAEQFIEDFGDKIEGARKDYASKLADAKDSDVSAVPLSQSWPEPKYQKMLDNGVPAETVALVRALRDEVPTKPQKGWKLKGWVEMVTILRDLASTLMESQGASNKVIEQIRAMKASNRTAREAKHILGRMDLYQEFGHEDSFKGITFEESFYQMYMGENNVTVWEVERLSKATAFGNMPRTLATGKTREEALVNLRKALDKIPESTKAGKAVRFNIYRDRYSNDVFIGKKIGKDVVRLKSFDDDVSAARKYLSENQQALESQLEKMKHIPAHRRQSNSPRVGVDHRKGGDVTPEAFADTFGFRGVQFGNYVEQGRRQADLNEAFDSLMDLAGILDIPAKAISLNGELGLAFGARGKGGKNAPMAHYEPGTVVINLTKRSGAGSLAHEWFHSLDNYFGRARGAKSADRFATRGESDMAVRPEVVEAFRNVKQTVNRIRMKERSRSLDKMRTKPYWSTDVEMTARAFESYVIEKLRDQGASNDYLANIVSEDYWRASEALGMQDSDSYPYPEAAEIPEIRAAYDHLFHTVEAREGEDGNVALFSRDENYRRTPGTRTESMTATDARAVIDGLMNDWKGAPKVTVAESISEFPSKLRDAIREAQAESDMRAVFWNDQVYVLAPRIPNEQALQEVILHEVVGHYGLRGMLGSDLKPILSEVYVKFAQSARAKEIIRNYFPGNSFDSKNVSHRLTVAEELLAHMAETGKHQKLWTRIMAAIRDGLRRLGFTLDLSETDLLNLLSGAQAVVENGGFSRLDGAAAMFSRTGARAIDQFDDLTDAQRRAFQKIAPLTPKESAKEWFAERTSRWQTKLRQGMVDRYAALMDVDEALHGKDVVENSTASSSWVLAQMAGSASGALQSMLTSARIYLDPREKVIKLQEGSDRGLNDVLKQLGNSGEIDRFFGWIAGNRSRKLMEEGRENLFDAEEVEALATANTGTTASGESRSELYDRVFEEFQQYRDDVLAIADAAGLLRKGMEEDQAMLFLADKYDINPGLAERVKKAKRKSENAEDADEQDMAQARYGQLYTQLADEVADGVDNFEDEYDALTTDQRELWANDFYVPFYREMENQGRASGPIPTSGLSRQKAYQRLKGGSGNLRDLLENTMMNFHHLIQASLKNQAAMQAIDNAEALGIAETTSESRRDTENSTFILKDGVKHWYNIDDPLVFKAVTALAHPGMNSSAMKVMRGFKRLFTNLTTTTPQFVIANLLRDSMQAMATSEVSKNMLKNMVKGSKAYGNQRIRAAMMASGGSFSFGHLYGENADEVKLQLTGGLARADILRSPSMIPAAISGVWRHWNDVTNFTENINRAAIYEQNKNDKGDLYAAFKARDLMNFSQHGAWPAMRILIDVVPFLNARLQGLDKIYRAGVKPGIRMAFGQGGASDKQAMARFWTVTGALALASMALFLKNREDEEFKKLEEWQKDTYWFVRTGKDSAMFIPKPFEVGAIATLVERLTEQAVSDTATGKLFAERLGHMLMDTFSFSPVPQMFQPALDVYANYDAFTGRPIESMGMERLSPSLRARGNTTAMAKGMSKISEAISGADGQLTLSPVQIDHMINGYFGAVGSWIAGVGDTIWRTANGEVDPAKRWYENQPVRRFYKNLGDEDKYTRYGTVFYESLKEANRVYADIREYQAIGDTEAAIEVLKENRQTLALRKTLNRVQRQLSDINQAMQKVYRMPGDSEYKRRELDRLRAMRNRIQEAVGRRLEELKASAS